MADLKPIRAEVELWLTDVTIHATARQAFYDAIEFAKSDHGLHAQGELMGKLGKLLGDFNLQRNLQVARLQSEVIRLTQFSAEPLTLRPGDLSAESHAAGLPGAK